MLSRRDFVKGGVALVSIGTTAQSLLKGAVAFAAQNPDYVNLANNGKILVLVQLAGGNDGLRTVVPVGDSTYHSVRTAIGFKDEELLPLDSGFGLAPQLKGLKGLWDAGHLAVVRGVGYPEQNYSHFRSMAIWQAGDPELKLQDGWLGRTLDQMESQQHDPFLGLQYRSVDSARDAEPDGQHSVGAGPCGLRVLGARQGWRRDRLTVGDADEAVRAVPGFLALRSAPGDDGGHGGQQRKAARDCRSVVQGRGRVPPDVIRVGPLGTCGGDRRGTSACAWGTSPSAGLTRTPARSTTIRGS